jgi:hypothetical protein
MTEVRCPEKAEILLFDTPSRLIIGTNYYVIGAVILALK